MISYRPIRELIEHPITGEWGASPVNSDGVNILRTTNFTNNGSINFDNVVLRKVSEEKIDKKKLQNGDVIIERSGGSPKQPVGRVVFYDRKDNEIFLCNNFTSILRPSKEVEPKYLFWALFYNHLIKKTLRYQNKTTGIINLRFNDYLDEKIYFPNKSMQQNIVEKLDLAILLSQKRKKSIKLLDDFLRSIFLEMFGDPVLNYKDFSIHLLGDISTKIGSGSTPKGGSKIYLSNGITFLRSQNILMNEISLKNVAFISDLIHENMKNTWVKNGDVLFNITGASIGRVSYFNGKDDSANVNQHVCIIRPLENKLNPIFLSYLISHKNYQRKIKGQNTGGTREAFNFEKIKRFEIPTPPIELQNKFANIVQQVEKLKSKYQESDKELDNLFGSLMHRAFKGELNLSN